MIELKFRAWDADNQMFHYPETYLEAHKDKYNPMAYAMQDFWFMALVHNWVIQQYIGRKDKNGIEIYDGDIAQYDNLSRCKTADETDHPIQDILWSDYLHGWRCPAAVEKSWTVIGNIYENPELLKVKE